MMGDISVREATRDDAKAIKHVARDSWHAVYDSVLGVDRVDETVESWYDPERLITDDIEQNDRLFFVGVVDETVVGFVETVPDESDDKLAHLYRLYVASDYWGRGIGSSLLDHIETVLEEQGFDRLQLSVMAENNAGVSFYESNGFQRTSTTQNEQLDFQQYEYLKHLD